MERHGWSFEINMMNDSQESLHLVQPLSEREFSSESDASSRDFTPSLINFDRPKAFMEDVKVMVTSQITEERNRRLASPSWVQKAQGNLNHTGEHPLIVQQYLSSNKKEQEDGVLPIRNTPKTRFLSKSAGCSESRETFQHSTKPHQYLTATTETRKHCRSLTDYRLGRPTKTSLLRAKKRHPSAPGVTATITAKTDNDLIVNSTTKENLRRCRSAGTPRRLSGTSGETLHQFLVGARYNRGHYHDAKCLTELGLYVCRNDTANCFVQTSVSNDGISRRASLSDSSKCQLNSRWTMPSKPATPRNPESDLHPRGIQPSCGQIQSRSNDRQYVSSAGIRDGTLDHQLSVGKHGATTPTKGVADSKDVVEDSCVLCQSGIPLRGAGSPPAWSRAARGKFDPAKRWAGRKNTRTVLGSETSVGGGPLHKERSSSAEQRFRDPGLPTSVDVSSGLPQEVQQLVLQQYQLRIMGTRIGVNRGTVSATREKCSHQNPRRMTGTPSFPRAKSAAARVNANNNNDGCLYPWRIERNIVTVNCNNNNARLYSGKTEGGVVTSSERRRCNSVPLIDGRSPQGGGFVSCHMQEATIPDGGRSPVASAGASVLPDPENSSEAHGKKLSASEDDGIRKDRDGRNADVDIASCLTGELNDQEQSSLVAKHKMDESELRSNGRPHSCGSQSRQTVIEVRVP